MILLKACLLIPLTIIFLHYQKPLEMIQSMLHYIKQWIEMLRLDEKFVSTKKPSGSFKIAGFDVPEPRKLADQISEDMWEWILDEKNWSIMTVRQPHPGSLWISVLDGTWGTNDGNLGSFYYHPLHRHTATTIGKMGQKRVYADADDWAVSIQVRGMGSNRTFYNTLIEEEESDEQKKVETDK